MIDPMSNKLSKYSPQEVSISVIIPAYNAEMWIEECINSVVNQTVAFNEILIIDDGSDDRTFEICNKYSNRYANIRVIKQANRGLGASRNIGIKSISSDYYVFLDSDDMLSDDAHEVLLKYAKDGYDVVFYNASCIGEAGLTWNKNEYIRGGDYSYKPMSGESLFQSMYPKDYRPSACLAMYKRDYTVKNSIFFPEGILYEDNLFSFMIITCPCLVIHIPGQLYIRRYRRGSITTTDFSSKKLRDLINVYIMTWSFAKEKKLLSVALYVQYCAHGLLRVLDFFLQYSSNYAHKKDENTGLLIYAIDQFAESVLHDRSFIDIADVESKLIIYQVISWAVNNHCLSELCSPYDIDEIRRWGRSFYIDMLSKTKLDNTDYVVGIYGVGEDTEGLIRIYQRIYGEFKARVIYIDSKKNGEYFKDNLITDYQSAREMVDILVISTSKAHRDILKYISSFNDDIGVVDINKDINVSCFRFVEDCLL